MRETQRLFVTEGSVHLYSSLPIALTPADLYDGRNNQNFRDAIADCNLYVIATRERILIQPERVSFVDNILHGNFIVRRENGWVQIPFCPWRSPELTRFCSPDRTHCPGLPGGM